MRAGKRRPHRAWLALWLIALAPGRLAADEPATPDELLATARGLLGFPYVYGGQGTYGFDCSSFVQTVYGKHGYELPRTSRGQSIIGEPVTRDAIQPGDLLFFTETPRGERISHVGIAIDANTMIHASTGRGEVVVDPLGLAYYTARLHSVRRILGTPFAMLTRDTAQGTDEVEHEAPPPPTLAAAPRLSAWHHGPLSLTSRATELGGRVGIARLPDRTVLVLSPTATLRSEELDAEVVLAAPWAFDLDSQVAAWRYDEGAELWRLVETVRIGTPDARAHLELSRELSATLGSGLLVSRATPAMGQHPLPGLPAHAAPAARARLATESLGLDLFADDLAAPAILALRLARQGRLELAATVTHDPEPRATESGPRSAGAGELALALFDGTHVDATLDAAFGLITTREPSLGGSAGAKLELERYAIEGELFAAWHWVRAGFVPHLFGLDYRARSRRSSALWDGLDAASRSGGLRTGWELGSELAFTRRLGLRALVASALTRADTEASNRPGALEVGLLARELYVAATGWFVSAHLTLHWFGRDDELAESERILAFTGARLRWNRYVELGAHGALELVDREQLWSTGADLTLKLPW